MSKKITLNIGSHDFDINVEEVFAEYLITQMTKDFDFNGTNDIKVLLQSYVKKNHELFMQEEKINLLMQKLSL